MKKKLDIQESALEQGKKDSSKELIKREEIENTPFTIVTVNKESFGAMGEYRITEPRETAEEVREELKEINWNRIVQVMMILTKKITENEN
jgi:hypothetical protein